MNHVLPPTDRPTLITTEVARRAVARANVYAERAEAIHRTLKARVPSERELFPGVSSSPAFWLVNDWGRRAEAARLHHRRAALAANLAGASADDVAIAREHATTAVAHALAAADAFDAMACAAERWATWSDQIEAAQAIAAAEQAATDAAAAERVLITSATALFDDIDQAERAGGPADRPTINGMDFGPEDTVYDAVIIDEFSLPGAVLAGPA